MEKEEKEIEECAICFEHKISTNMHCYECNKYICIHCCNNLSSRTSLLFTESKNIFVKYQCPYCRYTNNKHIKLFNKNEITSIYTDTLTQLSVLHKHNDILINNYNYLYNENKRLKDEINNKNSEIIEIKELLLSNKNDVEQLENY